ncbi:hypothetical protein XENTR_v10020328 [Xenopus tropicalis]|nr:hypothetical protein XENTR_v10020328 [Xenopus tropicalis]
MFIAHFPSIFPACVELMERYIRVGAHFWPDYTGGGTYHEQERRRIREELQGAFLELMECLLPFFQGSYRHVWS